MKKKLKFLILLSALCCLLAAFAVSASAADVVIDAEVVPTGYDTLSVEFTGGAKFITSTQFYLTYDPEVLSFDNYDIISARTGDYATVSEVEDGKLLVNFFAATHAYKNKMLKVDFDIIDTAASSYGFGNEIINMYESKDNSGANSSVLAEGFIEWNIPTITSLKYTIDPSEVFYNAGHEDGPTYNTLQVSAVWSNGITVEVPVGQYSVDCPTYSTMSNFYPVNISYKGVTETYTIAVGVPLPELLRIKEMPDKMSYLQDSVEAFDKTGLVVEAYYPDQSEPWVKLFDDEYTIEGFDTCVEPGTHVVYIKYFNCEAALEITIEPNIPSRIEITKEPDLLVYKQGSVDELMLSGIEVKAYFADGTRTVDTDDLVVEGFDPNKIGEQTITVTFRTMSAKFKVTVEPLVVYPSRIEIESLPIKLSYFQDSEESLVTTGMKVRGYYDDGTVESLRLNDLEFTGFDTSAIGAQTITVSHFGVTTTFEITIIKEPDPTDPVTITVNEPPTKREYKRFSNEEFELAGIELVATLANGDTVNVAIEDIEVSGFDLATDDDMIFVKLTYKGVSTAIIVAVVENPDLIFGDVDGDGSVSASDARLALRYTVDLEPNLTMLQVDLADFNRDGSVTASDARSILRVSVGLTP